MQKLADGTKYFVLSTKDFEEFTEEQIPSNVKYPATSGVTYISDNTDIMTYKKMAALREYMQVLQRLTQV